jgi:hypothetical protein
LPNYNLGKRIEITLQTSTCTRSDIEKWLHFLRERGISKPQAEAKMVVLMDSKDEDENNLHFLLKNETSYDINIITDYIIYIINCFRLFKT